MRHIWMSGGLAVITAVSVGWYWPETDKGVAEPTTDLPSGAQAALPEVPTEIESPLPAQDAPTASRKAFQAYEEYERVFQVSNAIREFLDSRHDLTDTERQYRSVELQRQLNQLEATDKVSDAEALVLRLALIEDTDAAAKAEGLALLDAYQREREARLAAYRANPDPAFRDYKTREAEIVQEVMAMEHYPNGLSRDAYLAKRLAEARQQAYQP